MSQKNRTIVFLVLQTFTLAGIITLDQTRRQQIDYAKDALKALQPAPQFSQPYCPCQYAPDNINMIDTVSPITPKNPDTDNKELIALA